MKRQLARFVCDQSRRAETPVIPQMFEDRIAEFTNELPEVWRYVLRIERVVGLPRCIKQHPEDRCRSE